MPEALAILVVVVALAACVWLSITTQQQLQQLRSELDQSQRLVNESQRQLNDTRAAVDELRRELGELKAVSATPPPPPRLPRARSGGLDDLREQLRAAHRDDEPEDG